MLLIVLQQSSAVDAAETDAWKKEIAARRTQYLDWVIEHHGKLEPHMKPLDGRAWSLNQARLFLNRDTDKASRYFETVKLTVDPDFMGIRLLKSINCITQICSSCWPSMRPIRTSVEARRTCRASCLPSGR